MKFEERLRKINSSDYLQPGRSKVNSIPECSLQDGCIFYGIRIVIPWSLQVRVLDERHEAHTGVVKMKAIARDGKE